MFVPDQHNVFASQHPGLAKAVARIIRTGQGDLATKDDIAAVCAELSAMKWVLGLLVALSVAILVRLLLN